MCHLLVDVGGGTVDISAYCVNPSPEKSIDVIHPPTGGAYGGAKVNQKFKEFLEALVEDKDFSLYLNDSDPIVNAKQAACLRDLLNDTFEIQKQLFGRKGGIGNKVSVRLPHSFFRKYRAVLERKLCHHNSSQAHQSKEVELIDQDLRISYAQMKKFFEPVVVGIVNCIRQTLDGIDEDVDTVYLVGGFGGSLYMYNQLKQKLGDEYEYVIPEKPHLAVASGAVTFRRNPEVVRARKADATYGVRVCVPFDELTHEEQYKCEKDGRVLCQNVFGAVVERGDTIQADKVFCNTHPVASNHQDLMHVDVYSSTEKDVWYTTGKRPASSDIPTPAIVHKIGEVVVPLPRLPSEPPRGVDEDDQSVRRMVDLMFDFSHAEIQVMAYDHATNTHTKGILDLLVY